MLFDQLTYPARSFVLNLICLFVLQGRNITVKLADSKNKATQGQLPPTLLPIPIPISAAFSQPGKNQVSTATAYAPYPQLLPSYPPVSYPGAPTPYPHQSHGSYSPLSAKKEHIGFPSAPPTGLSGYPYYR